MIRNREAASIQITAEQLIKDARTQFGETTKAVAGSSYLSKDDFRIQDKEEYAQFLQKKRKEYEDRIRRHRRMLRAYLDYARFEAAQDDYRRCRSVLERAVTVLSSEPSLWLAYAEIEAKGGFQNHALNVLHRAVGLLPRVDSLWFKYVLFQETLGTEDETREVFERWMSWEPKADEPWFAYASFEERHNQIGRARDVYERYCGTHPTSRAYIKYAKWEDSSNRVPNARAVFERAVGAVSDSAELPATELDKPDIWLAFAQFEARRNEPERARAVYQFALDKVLPEYRGRVFAGFASFEKRLREEGSKGEEGDEEGKTKADAIVVLRRREEYETAVREDPMDYDAWFDLARLEESSGSPERVRDVYRRAQANVPPVQEKRAWRRFVYLFIYESVYEELIAKDVSKARDVYHRALEVIPHRKFTFAKIWILAAQLEIRARRLQDCRKLLGRAIGLCPKDKLFRTYIQLELQLGQVDRCRLLYEKYLVWNPTNSQAWSKYAEMERAVGETTRARKLYELGVQQPVLDEPEKLWMRYIDFELASDEEEEEQEEEESKEAKEEEPSTGAERARALYERLVERTEGKQSKVWIAYAKFLAFSTDRYSVNEARECLERAETVLKAAGQSEGRAMVCQARAELEQKVLDEAADGKEKDASHLEKAIERIPKRVENVDSEDGTVRTEWLFPADVLEAAKRAAEDEEAKKKAATLRLLEMAEKRKKQKMMEQQQAAGSSE